MTKSYSIQNESDPVDCRMNSVLSIALDNFQLKISREGSGRRAIVIGSHKYYPRVFSENLKSKLELICLDTRGFAPYVASQTQADFTVDKIMQDIEALQVKLANQQSAGVPDQIILIGHSIHAFMALEYARRYPDRVVQLVLIGTSPMVGQKNYEEADRYFNESVCPERKAAFVANMKAIKESGDMSFVSRMLAFGPRLWYDHGFDASELWEGVEVNSMGAGIIWGYMFAGYDTASALKAIKCPIFLALGRYDYFNPPHLWEPYRSCAPDLTIRVFEKSGHTPQLEEPEKFDSELLGWLERPRVVE